MSEGGRKRQLEEVQRAETMTTDLKEVNPSPVDSTNNGTARLMVVDASESPAQNSTDDPVPQQPAAALPFLPLRKLRLEAVFHPKFENENQHLKTIRELMIDRCCAAEQAAGYLEVSIKHSGSLLLWSGGSRYYSKNATVNQFTAAGEILLRQHFVRAHWNETAACPTTETTRSELKYQECSDYVQAHRLTLSFEVVTTVLGDHGARPNRDFLILTAVADRTRAATQHDSSLFYSTVELMEFAQRFRLPHNDCWVYAEQDAVNAMFNFYDTCRETGTTSTAVPALTQASSVGSTSDCHVQSMYPHADFQGEIMEGIVIRYIPCTDLTAAMTRIARLSQQSRAILQAVPPSLPYCHELLCTKRYQDQGEEGSSLTVLTANLRQIHNESRATFSKKGVEEFEVRLLALIGDSPTATLKQLSRQTKRIPEASSSDLPLWIDDLLTKPTGLDEETRKIATLIQSLSKLSKSVVYSVYQEFDRYCDEDQKQSPKRYLCIVRVIHDQIFQKFQRSIAKGDMPLFRGFSFEMMGDSVDDGANEYASLIDTMNETTKPMTSIENCRREASGDETLMLKMKFLPYMVRTISCLLIF